MFMQLYREEKREEGDRCGQEDKGGNQKEKERKVQPVSSSLSVLHHLEHAKKFTELGREEKGREEIEVTCWGKGKSKGGESSQVSNLAPK